MHTKLYPIKTPIYIKWFLLLPLFFFFLPAMYIPYINIPIYDFAIGLVFLFLIIFTPSTFKLILKFWKYSFFKVLICFIFYIILSGSFLLIIGKYPINNYLYSIFLFFLYNDIGWYIYPGLVFPRFINFRSLIKFFILAVYIICLYGLLEYFCSNILHSNILSQIQNLIHNRRFMMFSNYNMVSSRLYGVFEEPGYLGAFLNINLPIIYNIIFSKFKILKAPKLNFLLKKTYALIIFLTVIAMQSPIWLLVYIVINLVYFHKNLLKHMSKICILFLLLILSFFIWKTTVNIDISKTFLNRIPTVINTVSNLELFRIKEPSLYSRIYCYCVRFTAFKDNFIIGVGYNNLQNYSTHYMQKISLPKPIENGLVSSTSSNYINKSEQIGGSILWTLLSDTGIIGTLLYYLFIILNIIKINNIYKLNHAYTLENLFMQGVKNSYILIIILSIYDIKPNVIWIWFLFGLNLTYITNYEYLIKLKSRMEEVNDTI